MKQTKKRPAQKGFTIIEVMIVIAIAGLIMVVALIAIPQLQRNQRNNARQSIISRISTELGNYAGNNNGDYPDDLGGEDEGFIGRYLSDVNINDPRTGDPMDFDDGVSSATSADDLGLDDDQSGDLGTVFYSPGLSCDGENIASGSGRTFALYSVMEGGAVYCLDNS